MPPTITHPARPALNGQAISNEFETNAATAILHRPLVLSWMLSALFLTLPGLAPASPGENACAPAPPGLVGWWQGEDNASDRAGQRSGTAMNGAAYTDGMVGRAFHFDGQDDYVDASGLTSVTLTTAMTIEAWVRPDSVASDAILVSQYDASASQCGWRLELKAGGRIRFEVAGERRGVSYRAVETVEAALLASTFSHIAVTFDGPNQAMTVWVDGIQRSVTVDPLSRAVNRIYPVASSVWLGAFRAANGSTARHFAGTLDEVSIYRRALSPPEIALLHQAGAKGKCLPVPLEVSVDFSQLPPKARATLRVTGGQPPHTITFVENRSGGVLAESGLGEWSYRAGPTGSVSDEIRVTDQAGTEVRATIEVQPLTFIEWPVAAGGNGHRYARTLLASDWFGAENLAYSLGGHLVAINSPAEQDFLNATFLTGPDGERPYWIGLRDDSGGLTFLWTTLETVFDFGFWETGEPDLGMNEGFGAMNWQFSVAADTAAKGRWSDQTVGGSIGAGGGSDGPYHGILELPALLAINPASTNIPTGGHCLFTASGGNPPYVFTIAVNASGATVTRNNFGNYVAGVTSGGVDIVRVTDSLGATAEASVQVTPLGYVEWTTAAGGNGHRYALTPVAASWQAAAELAVRLEGSLVAITSAAEQQFLTDTFLRDEFERRPLWIGLGDYYSPGQIGWNTGEPLSFTFWADGEPAGQPAGSRYVAMNWHYANPTATDGKGRWADLGLFGSSGAGDNTDGPYHGIVELPVPLTISPSTTNVSVGETIQFTVAGAEGAVTFTFENNPALGTIQPATGLYTARNYCSGTDRVRVTDSLGRRATAIVQYVDRRPPSITCPAGQTIIAAPDGTAPVPFFFPYTYSDNCSGVTLGQFPPGGSLVSTGLHIVTLIGTDASGNTNTCTTSLNVLERTYIVSGLVTNLLTGAPMTNQRVRLVHYHESYRVFLETRTDAAGAYRFTGIPASHLLSVFPENRGYTYAPSFVRKQDFAADLIANFGATAPPPADPAVAVTGIEIVQSIQDWRNSVPLIANKDTHVRVHIRNHPADGSTASRAFTGKLRGFRNGVELSDSPLGPLAPGYASTDGDTLSRRRTFELGTLNFHLPASWCAVGNLDLQLQPDATTPAACADPAEASGNPGQDCTVRATFQAQGILRLKILRAMSERTPLSIAEVDATLRQLQAMFPLHALDVQWGEFYPGLSMQDPFRSLDYALKATERQQMMEGCAYGRCGRIYFGAFAQPVIGGVAYYGTGTACGNLYTLPHEIGHTLALDHTVRGEAGCPECGFCGERAGFDLSPFPFPAEINGRTLATLGPMDPAHPEDMIFGLFPNAPPDFAANGGPVVDPYAQFEMMSYCNDLRPGWISSHNYSRLITAIGDRFPAGGQLQAAAALPSRDFYLVGGSVRLADGSATIDPLSPVNLPDPGPPPAGNYSIQLLNASGAVLSETSFQPNPPASDGPADTVANFNVLVPYSAEAVRAVVRSNAVAVAEVSRSGHAPMLAVLAPSGGEVFSGESIPVQWTASDLDADSLTFTVQYSGDGGATFATLATGLTNDFLEVSRSSLAASPNALFRVIVSDGFNHDSQTSPLFTVDNNPPVLLLRSPSSGSTFTGDASILFAADAYDVEDGPGLAAISWRSSLDGDLGTGPSLQRNAQALSAGLHVITVTATDQALAMQQSQFTILVQRARPLTLQPLNFDTNGAFGLRIAGDEGARYVLEMSTNLQAWLPLQTNTLPALVTELRDGTATNRLQRFYRAAPAP